MSWGWWLVRSLSQLLSGRTHQGEPHWPAEPGSAEVSSGRQQQTLRCPMKVPVSFPQTVESWHEADGELAGAPCWPVAPGSTSVGPYMCDALEARPSGHHFKITNKPLSQTVWAPASALCPGVDEFTCVSPLRTISPFTIPLRLLWMQAPWA